MKGENGVKEAKHGSLEPEVGQGYGEGNMKNESGHGKAGYTIPHEHEMKEHHRGLAKEPKATMGEHVKGSKHHPHATNHHEHDSYLHESMPEGYKGDVGY